MAVSNVVDRLLMIVPPYRHCHCPPAAAAVLLGHLRDAGETMRFLDLRLVTPDILSPTYNPVGLFGESFVMDVPDLPIVLRVIRAFLDGRNDFFDGSRDDVFDRYCLVRGIDPNRLITWLQGIDALLADALEGLTDLSFVGLSVWSSNLATSLMAAARLKRRPNAPFVVAGGPQLTESSASAQLALRSGLFDAVVLGEGESALLDILRCRARGASVDGLPRVMTRNTAPRNDGHLLKMSSLADPDFGEMSLATYRGPDGRLRLPFQLSRGCTDRCTFCSEWVFWERFRLDTVDHALDQIERLHARYGISKFHFTDSLLNGHMGRLRSFAQGLLGRNLSLDWGGFMRAKMDTDTARLLHTAGCTYAFIGVESLSDETLALMNKRRTRAENLEAIKAFLDAGVFVSVGVIPGFPGDTRQRFLDTVQHLVALGDLYPGRFSFNVEPFVASPNQPLFADLSSYGLKAVP